MATRTDRGVTPVLGFVLLLAIVVIAVAVWQTSVLPVENSDHEFRHYQSVSDDMAEIRDDILRAGSRGTVLTSNVDIGMRYPSRVLFINPGPVSGHLRTTSSRSVSFENVRAVSTEAQNTRSFWADSQIYTNETRDIEFSAEYNYNTDQELPPIVTSGETIFRASGNTVIPLGEQTLITGNRIQLTFITGNLSETGEDAPVVVEPQSMSVRTVTITGNDSGDSIRLRFDPPSGTTAGAWVSEFGMRINDSNDRVVDVRNDSGDVVLALDSNRTFHIRIASVSVGTEESNPERLNPAYIITREGDEQRVQSGQRTTVTAEVRDKYNNPVREAKVEFNVTDGDAHLVTADGEELDEGESLIVNTDAEGRATARLNSTSSASDVTVSASVVDHSGALLSTMFDVQIENGSG